MKFYFIYKFLHILALCFNGLLLSRASPFSAILQSSHSMYGRQNGVCAGHAMGEFVTNPENCRLFYLCMENGQAVMAACPPTMLFNPDSKLCDTVDNVQCEVESPNDGGGGSTNANASNNGNTTNTNSNNNNNNNNNTNTIGKENNNNNELSDATRYCASLPAELNSVNFVGSGNSCRHYYICYYGRAVLQECSANLHWNAKTAKCDRPENAGCATVFGAANGGQWSGGGAVTAGAGELSSGVAAQNGESAAGSAGNGLAPEAAGAGAGGELINCPTYGQHIFPHMERCDYFIYCVKGQAILQQCPFYYSFDIISRNCKWRTSAVCVRDLNINFRNLINA